MYHQLEMYQHYHRPKRQVGLKQQQLTEITWINDHQIDILFNIILYKRFNMDKVLKQSFSVFGRTTLRKFGKLKIYIQGLSKIGADLTTNLVMLSPHLITLHDPEHIKLQDCYSTFHYPKQHINRKTRADYLIQMCHRLNNKVYVDKVNTEISEQLCLNYDIIIFCDIYDLGRVLTIDKFIRQNKLSKTVVMYACQMGYFGLMITDFGQEWQMFHSGKQSPKISIKNITNAEQGQVQTAIPHTYKTGDFVYINYSEGMKDVNGDARPVKVTDQYKFLIQDTRSFGTYTKGGICEKINFVEKLKFQSMEQQLARRHSDVMLAAKAVICFYQNNSKLPQLFNQTHQHQAFQNLKFVAEKSKQKYDQTNVKNIIKTCSYSFYPLISIFSAILSLQCVKCTGKYKPTKSPFIIDWYDKIGFEVKKKIDGQFMNIIDTNTLEKLTQIQVGIIDDGSNSFQLLNLLYSCSIAQKTRVVLCGLQSINQVKQIDGLALKANLKYNVASELFKTKKTETMPCSLSFSNDLLLSDFWSKIKILINTSTKLTEYIYNNVIWNQIDIVDSTSSELMGILKMCVANKSSLKQSSENSEFAQLSDYRECVQKSLQQFRLLFEQIFQDVRCFFNIGAIYIDRVKMEKTRKNIFLFIICCLEDGSYMDPENIVKICKYVFNELFQGEALNIKDQIINDFMKSLYYLISWFFTKKEPKPEEITNQFNMHLQTAYQQPSLSMKDKYDIAYAKLAMGNTLTIPYYSLADLYRHEHTIKFIWNASQIHSRKLKVQDEVNSRKFYKYYFRKLKPCPFITQIINSLIPVAVVQNIGGSINNFEIDMIQGVIKSVDCPSPSTIKPKGSVTSVVPAMSNQWTIISIEGPKKIGEIIDRFNYMQNVTITKIRCENIDLFDRISKKNLYMDFHLQSCPQFKEKKDVYELHIDAEDKQGKKCEVSRVKYIVRK